MDWLKVYENFDDLPNTDKHLLFEAIKDTLFQEPTTLKWGFNTLNVWLMA